MPPRTRMRATKVLKENMGVVNESKADGRITKSSRKALADKTNSLSDDNASIDIPSKSSKNITRKKKETNHDDQVRPRRQRRLPPRYVENQTLKNLSNSMDSAAKQISLISETETTTKKPAVREIPIQTSQDVKSFIKQGNEIVTSTEPLTKEKELNRPEKTSKSEKRPKRTCRVKPVVESPSKNIMYSNPNVSSPFKTPSKDQENSLMANRPKRVCRLPSRLEDHSISPTKFIPVKPCHSSTPVLQKPSKTDCKNNRNVSLDKKNNVKSKKNELKISKVSNLNPGRSAINASNSSSDKSSLDTNNNGKKKLLKLKQATFNTKLQAKQISPDLIIKPKSKRLLDKNFSFKVFEDKQSNGKGLDVYEFTFDPNEEPPPKKKKSKRPAKKKPVKPKTVILKSTYEDNVSKALAHLKCKNVKTSQPKTMHGDFKPGENQEKLAENQIEAEKNLKTGNAKPTDHIQSPLSTKPTSDNIPQRYYSSNMTHAVRNESLNPVNASLNPVNASNYASICVEDIAADFEFSDHHDDINYSPVNSPHASLNRDQHNMIPDDMENNRPADHVNNTDPLNLQDDVSFFEAPIASSSMNISVPQPQASPWRVEFGSLPIKWHNNTYLKPNMTPAVECSFINSEATTEKKHVYTNLVPEPEQLPEIFENPAPALKQTSILSFFKEVVEKKANRKKRRHSETSTQGIFDELTKNSNESLKKVKLSQNSITTSNNINIPSTNKENILNTSNKMPEIQVNEMPEKKIKDNNVTFFGFDESENVDQENISPVKVNPNPKIRVLRSRNVLKELNTQPVPTRVVLPVSKAKLPSSEVVEQLYDQLKSTEDAQFPEKTARESNNTVVTNKDPSLCDDNEDSESVHLFEDIQVVHHLKPHRKSYGKAKKVTFQQSGNSDDSDSQPPVTKEVSSDDDDLADLSFHLPNVQERRTKRTKKKKPKKLLTRKEEKEVEEWAAGFNSMCEDVEEFPLLVEE